MGVKISLGLILLAEEQGGRVGPDVVTVVAVVSAEGERVSMS